MRTQLRAICAAYLLSLIGALIALAAEGMFGSGDLMPFAIYCVPFSIMAAAAMSVLSRVTQRTPIWLAVAVAYAAGLLFGWLGTLFVALFLGPWFGAMSVPVLQVWSMSAALLFSSGVLLHRSSNSRRVAAGLAVLVGFSLSASVGFRPALSLAMGNQHLTVYFFWHRAGNADLKFLTGASGVEPSDIDLLRLAGLRGTLQSSGSFSSSTTAWPRAKALIVLTHPPSHSISLPQPKHCTIVYVQEDNGFRRVPADAPILSRQIDLDPNANGGHFVVEHVSGASSGGDIGGDRN